jgi:hypothetical protein
MWSVWWGGRARKADKSLLPKDYPRICTFSVGSGKSLSILKQCKMGSCVCSVKALSMQASDTGFRIPKSWFLAQPGYLRKSDYGTN